MSVPSVIQTGEGAILLCDVDMENEVLYSVKWYKDNEEFFRFVPRDSSQFLVYNVEGINVNASGRQIHNNNQKKNIHPHNRRSMS